MRHRMSVAGLSIASSLLAVACSANGASTDPSINLASTSPASTSPPSTSPVTTVPASSIPASTVPAPVFDPVAVGAVSVTGPITGGRGAVALLPPVLDLAAIGYVEEEFFLSGTASAFEPTAPLAADGRWSVDPVSPVAYTTRIVVRRPLDPAPGSVAVEWLNVSAGFDSSPAWTSSHVELLRSGWTWVGVSAQQVGLVGRPDSVVPLAPTQVDPDRYATISHPGDSYSYDIFNQAGAALRTQPSRLLDGAEPATMIAIGQSQGAIRLTTFVNAIAPIARVYDGYLLQSRGAAGAPLSGEPMADIAVPSPTLIRTDLTVPVLNLLSETDVISERLGFVRARQPDTDLIRTWEVAGTSHNDAYSLGLADSDDGSGAADAALFDAMSAPPSEIYGGVISCDRPINAGPFTYVARSATASLAAWVETGRPPAPMPPLELDRSGALDVDDTGNALGGIRTPQVDVPIAALSGLGQSGETFCGLFGTTVPLDANRLAAAYPDRDTFVAAWNAAVDRAVESGAVLSVDGERLREVAAASNIGAPS